jgi:hypothetical protein
MSVNSDSNNSSPNLLIFHKDLSCKHNFAICGGFQECTRHGWQGIAVLAYIQTTTTKGDRSILK